VSYERGTPVHTGRDLEGSTPSPSRIEVQGLLEIKDTHRPYRGPVLLGIALP
jgi:hypothetical protein